MKIAGVSISLENLPSREEVLKLALNTKEFQSNSNREEEINTILDNSKLWGVITDTEQVEDGLRTNITVKTKSNKRK